MTHIYRYNFDNEFVKELYIFAKIHQYDNRIDFKEGWNIWVEDNNDIIEFILNDKWKSRMEEGN